MYKLCRIDIERSEELLEDIRKLALKIKAKLPVSEIYIYGSFAKGEIHEGSDIDLLIIGDFKERLFDRIGKILDLTDLPVEPLVYTNQEFEYLRSSKNPFITNILENAIKIG